MTSLYQCEEVDIVGPSSHCVDESSRSMTALTLESDCASSSLRPVSPRSWYAVAGPFNASSVSPQLELTKLWASAADCTASWLYLSDAGCFTGAYGLWILGAAFKRSSSTDDSANVSSSRTGAVGFFGIYNNIKLK